MTARLGIREGAISAVVFAAVMFALMSIDPHVRDKVTEVWVTGGIRPWGDRLGDLLGTMWTALRTQSIDNAPALVFVTVSGVLTLFMLRS